MANQLLESVYDQIENLLKVFLILWTLIKS